MACEFPESKLLAAAFLFESANGNVLGPSEASEIARAGLGSVDASDVAVQICDTLNESFVLSQGYRSAAFFALAKRMDAGLLEFFRRHLAVELNRDMQVTYQIMIALDNLKEPVWPPTRCLKSIADEVQNWDTAKRYLNNTARPT